jgi:hypothetical protein
MWQLVVVLFVIAAVLIYVIRHYLRILRGQAAMCCCCSECGMVQPQDGRSCSYEISQGEGDPARSAHAEILKDANEANDPASGKSAACLGSFHR